MLIEYLKIALPDTYGLSLQLDYYNCLMALVNVVNTARGGLSSGFSERMRALLDYLNVSDFRSSLGRCNFKKKQMSISKRVGLRLLRFKLYRAAVIMYAFKSFVMKRLN